MFERAVDAMPEATALECGDAVLSYGELDKRANRLAHLLRDRGVAGGSRVAILLERSVWTYVALLGVAKVGATFVPVDPASPPDRVAYVAEDSDVALVLTSTDFAGTAEDLGRPWLALDDAGPLLAEAAEERPRPPAGSRSDDGDPPAYIIYTSGSSGRPKGVAVAESSIVNFVEVVRDVYDVRPDDRVYQGMTISFDFSIEEIWPTWAVGATLVAGPNDERRLGADLADFLDVAAVTVVYCVPTLLATIPRDLPRVRAITVGGEACPAELVERWSRPGRRMLNTYGPTEATVTATWTELEPGKPVTIGRPLPTYTAELTDPDDPRHRPIAAGEIGEITLGGPGVALGYVGRPDLTAEKFIADPREGRCGRVYRTGDLGRFTDDGEIEYLGRADAEVKVRGHRVDLGEIESVLLTDDQVGAAVVALDPGHTDGGHSDGEGSGDLAAYVVPPAGTRIADPAELTTRVHHELTDRLPDYMLPATLDVLDELPTQVSGKVDRTQLPAPTGRRLVGDTGPRVAAEGQLEQRVAAVWAEAFGLGPGELSVTADFFDDLGGHSLLAATTVTRMRERLDGGRGGSVAVRDLYAHPTVRALASHLDDGRDRATAPAAPRAAPVRHSDRRVAGAGSAQAVMLYLFLLVTTLPFALAYTRWDGTYSAGFVGALVAAVVITYIGARWVLPLLARPLAAGIRPGRYRLWGATYLRLWAVDQLVGLSPLSRLGGSPFTAPYLRLLGARVGHRTHLATADLGLPALLEIGDDATVGYGVHLRPWHVDNGWVVVAPIRIDADASIGSGAVVEPGAQVGARAALTEQSVLPSGTILPAGQTWSGSPAAPADDPGADLSAMRANAPLPGWRARHVVAALAGVVGLEMATLLMVAPSPVFVVATLRWGGEIAALAATALSGLVSVVAVCTVVALGRKLVLPRTPAGIHPLRSGLGLRKWAADALLTDSLAYTNTLYATLYTTPWLRLLGARIGPGCEVSTASHLDPDLLTIDRESFVADMVSVGAASFANGRMALRNTEVGERAFIGNAAVVPAGTRTARGSLVGVHTVPPREGVREDSSWLGSPAIDLPRREDSGSYDESTTFRPGPARVAGRLAIELLRIIMPASLTALGVYGLVVLLVLSTTGLPLPATILLAPLAAAATATAVAIATAMIKWLVVGRYRPRVEPLWNTFVRRTELVTGLFEAAAVPAMAAALTGTPLLPAVLRLFGARIGRRVWMGTTFLTEFDLVEVSDDAAVGRGVSLQTHLFEDRVMKMSHVRVGEGATIGDRSIVLYDSVVGPDVALDALSLLMKGEQLPGGSRWRGIPAQASGT